jgi:5-hydroxyisourate hydrolase
MSITTHVLDTAIGRPAAGIEVHLERQMNDGSWSAVGSGRTDADGRVRNLMPPASEPIAGTYRLTFETAPYFKRRSVQGFYPRVVVEFVVRETGSHHHVPLLLSPFGYSTYRGS